MNRKIIILIIVILIILALLTGYFLFSKKPMSKLPIISALFPETKELKKEVGKETEISSIKILSSREKNELKILNITQKPIVSAEISGSSTLRFIDMMTGHIYETNFNGDEQKKLSNTTILNIFDASWGKEAKSAIIKFLNADGQEINIYSAEFNGSSTIGVFLPNNVKSAAASKTENKIAYLTEEQDREFVFTADIKNGKKKRILNLPASDFTVSFRNTETINILTKPSAFSKGYLYLTNTKTENGSSKNLNKITEGNGLNILWSYDSEKIFIFETINGQIKNRIENLKNKQTFKLPIKTFPEKCVFSRLHKEIIFCAIPLELPQHDYPDDWYMGKVNFKDNLYEINYETGDSRALNQKIENENFDIENLFLDTEENYVFFIDKNDKKLWRVRIRDGN